MVHLVGSDFGPYGLKLVDSFHAVISAPRLRFTGVLSLVVVEVDVVQRHHNHIVPRIGRLDTPLETGPRHHGGVRSQTPFENLVVANHRFAFGVEVLFDAVDEIALQFVFILESFGAFALLAQRASAPLLLAHFVAADVDVGCVGEEFNYLVQNIG